MRRLRRRLRNHGRHGAHQIRPADDSGDAACADDGQPLYVIDTKHLGDLSQRRLRFDRHDRRAHDLLDWPSAQRLERFGQGLTISKQGQPPVAPGDTVGVAATEKVAFADHSKQLLVGAEHGNGADAFFQQQARDVAHAGSDRNGDDSGGHKIAGRLQAWGDFRLFHRGAGRFVGHAILSVAPRKRGMQRLWNAVRPRSAIPPRSRRR